MPLFAVYQQSPKGASENSMFLVHIAKTTLANNAINDFMLSTYPNDEGRYHALRPLLSTQILKGSAAGLVGSETIKSNIAQARKLFNEVEITSK